MAADLIHHRAACAEAGVLGRRGFPLECAAAQVCREAGARVATNVLVRDMDLAAFNALDSRRLEVVADGLTLWHGAQLAETDFGQTDFGHPYFPTLAKSDFGQTDFGQKNLTDFGQF